VPIRPGVGLLLAVRPTRVGRGSAHKGGSKDAFCGALSGAVSGPASAIFTWAIGTWHEVWVNPKVGDYLPNV
jgi:hypothetical protein